MKIIRALDVLVALFLLIVLLPISITTIMVLLFSKGPVFFKQYRRGFRARKIMIYKFRTMHVGSEKYEAEIIKKAKEPNVQNKNDSRITKIGRILRKTSADEIPQLVNVLKGTMSIVGPRPIIEEEFKMLNKKQLKRFEVLPGITGLAQTTGRSNLSIQKALEKDIEWVEKHNLKNYLKVMFKTIVVVFKKDAF